MRIRFAAKRESATSGRRAQAAGLARDRRGATMPMMAMGLLPIIAALGGAVDYSRMYLVKSQLQTAVDAAALAGARAFQVDDGTSEDRDTLSDAYLNGNYVAGYMGSSPLDVARKFETKNHINITSITATTTLPMVFMRIFGINETTLSATAIAEVTPKPLEVMVVLDNTGSMQEILSAGKTRMQALQEAMLDFVSTLHQGADTRPELALGMITYNVTTNVGHILKENGVAVADVDGFTNVGNYTGSVSTFPDNPLAWKGCVNNDTTIQDLDADVSKQETGAWDVGKVLPGEEGNPAVTPYHYMPNTTSTASYLASVSGRSATATEYTSSDKNWNSDDNRRNNLYRLAPIDNPAAGNALANTAAYRQHFYDMYIGLNFDATNINDDVIVNAADGGYYNPTTGGAWSVRYDRVPRLSRTDEWKVPNPKYGYPISRTTPRNGFTLWMPSPNFQCPEPGMKVAYGRQRSEYETFINEKNYAVMPASGTLHHIGMLWGYRLLVRDDVFTRDYEGPEIKPRRALVFMTDGEANAGGHRTWSSAYGMLKDRKLSASNVQSTFETQIMRRFGRVCEAAKRDKIEVYIVSLKVSQTVARNTFKACAGNHFLETGDTAQIKKAFNQIANELVDLHLVQ